MQETYIQSLGQEDPLEKAVAPHSSTLAWEIPWTGAWWAAAHGVARAGHVLATKQQQQGDHGSFSECKY